MTSSRVRISNSSSTSAALKIEYICRPVGPHRNQAFGIELAQRFAHRHPADAEPIGYLRRIEPRVARQFPAENLVAQEVISLLLRRRQGAFNGHQRPPLLASGRPTVASISSFIPGTASSLTPISVLAGRA